MTLAIATLSVVICLFSVAPFWRAPFGAVRVMAFPRQQLLGLALVLIAPALWLDGTPRLFALALLGGSVVINLAYILPYTPLWRKQSRAAGSSLLAQPDRQLTILTANVKLSNRAYGRLASLIEKTAPDLLLLIEVDDAWLTGLEPVLSPYRCCCTHPLDNGYGMALYARLPLDEVEVTDLLVAKVPSIRARVKLRSGDQIRLHVVHPEPPMPNHSTGGRDGELGLVAQLARDDTLPVIVSGDLNDVAWSQTTRRFQRISRLLDPRIGRGFYNTFHAGVPFVRWPLDHLFHDARFRLIDMRRLPAFGSDHFAMAFTLALADSTKGSAGLDPATQRDHAEVSQSVRAEADQDREALGSDWEKPDG